MQDSTPDDSRGHQVSPHESERVEAQRSGPRVGIVTHYMPPHLGGIEIMAETLYKLYAGACLDVRWVASRVPATSAPSENGRIRVGCWNLLERQLGVPWPVWGPTGVRELSRLVQWADVLHVHDSLYFGSALAVLLARRARKPVLLSQHIGFVEYRSRALNGIERLANHTLGRAVWRGASHLVFCTPAADKFVTGLFAGRLKNTSVIPNGIDTQRFRPPSLVERTEARASWNIPSGNRVVLFVGRLVEKKGVHLFLDVCKRLPSCHFFVVGDGPLRPKLPLELPNLTWAPTVPPEQMEKVYHAADAFLLPSHGEGFPVTVQEAMASGVPVVLPKGEEYTVILEREKAAILAERDPAALSEALLQLWEAPERLEAVAVRARELVQRKWSHDIMGAEYIALIRRLIGGGGEVPCPRGDS